LSLRERATEQVKGKPTSESLVLFETSSGKPLCELEGSRDVDLSAGDVAFSPSLQYIVGPLERSAPNIAGEPVSKKVRMWNAKS
jgi:hypothetical protein